MDLSDISLASISLDSCTCADVICGSNGLPLTPNSIKITGNFKARVEHVRHPNLITYVECFRDKNERVTLVFEDLTTAAPNIINEMKVTKQLLDALYHLHRDIGCVHGLITPDCLVWTAKGDLKLAHWPINLLTDGGQTLGAANILPIDLSFMAPERLDLPEKQSKQCSDIWAACLALLKLLRPNLKLPENPCRLAFCDKGLDVLDKIDDDPQHSSFNDPWYNFFLRALDPDPSNRASLEELYAIMDFELPMSRSDPLYKSPIVSQYVLDQENISNLTISEIYYLWRLSIGRNFESDRKQDDCPPIFKIPYLIVGEKFADDSEVTNNKLKSHMIISTKPTVIPLDVFKLDMAQLDERIFHPLVLTDEEVLTKESSESSSNHQLLLSDGTSPLFMQEFEHNNPITVKSQKLSFDSFTFADLDNLSSKSINNSIQAQLLLGSSKMQPIVIKEADFAYQCERIILFKRLISGCPYLKEQLRREASVDIPPYFRAQTWAILLDVVPERSRKLYETIDKTTPIATDRQISVDIPRCHQYNELMASPQGHQKLARILKAWLNHNSANYVYWQGLDSLAAPFLLLNFNDESLAFACFNAFVDKYLKGFFKKDNQLIVQQYLSMFSELLLYHDSSLANHLSSLGFLPNLYAIPWFLTMFTHVLPLHKILHVWDCLLLGDEKFPLCIGLAILNQLRHELMNFSFNDCIVAFSDLPEIDIERCIKDASHFYNSTPDKLIDLKTVTTLVDI